MHLDKLKSTVQDLVAANDLDTALSLMMKEIKNDGKAFKMVINISANVSDLKQSVVAGNVSFEKNQERRNTIRANILDIFDFLKEEDLVDGAPAGTSPDQESQEHDKIQVFLSLSTPFNEAQEKFLEHFQEKFKSQGLELVRARWSSENPLLPVREIIREVSGCVVLALERMKTTESIYKPGSPKESKEKEEYFTTPWIQMEAAMAYQQGIPIIIFSDQKLKMEGMIEMGVHEFRIFKIDPSDPDELDNEYYTNLFEYWAGKVKKHYLSTK